MTAVASAPNNSSEFMPSSRIAEALVRIAPHITRTPLLSSSLLNQWLGHEITFKYEGFQRVGAFKARGALNALLVMKEQNRLPSHVVAYSSGNHAQAVAMAGGLLGVRTTVIMPKFVSRVKQQATISYGAELILTDTRQQAEALAAQKAAEGAWFLHPSAHDDMIAGQGTACLEALEDGPTPDAIFAACGGGGLLSGSWLAAQALAPQSLVFGAEPTMANDAAQSVRTGKIVTLAKTPMTIADGARTLAISESTFKYLKKLAGFYEIEEEQIIYWTQWVTHMLKVSTEPTAALAMAAAALWLKEQKHKKRVLVILSGANIDGDSRRQLWQKSYLEQLPIL